MSKINFLKKVIGILGITALMLNYMIVPQYAFITDNYPYNIEFTQISLSSNEDIDCFAGIDMQGSLWMFGENSYGQLGNSIDTYFNPIKIMEEMKFSQVSLGPFHSAAIDIEGNLWTWGSNNYGQLGDGTTTNSNIPIKIMEGTKFSQVSLGNFYSAAIDVDGNLYTWGYNDYGQLGDGTRGTNVLTPTIVASGKKFSQVSLGMDHSAAIDTEGNLWTWGSNAYTSGKLGDGTDEDSSIPIKIMEETKFSQVSLGESHSAAIDTEGNLWSWGNNRLGQLGDGTTTNSNIPIKIKEGTKFKQISLKNDCTSAIDEENNLWIWGFNKNFGGEIEAVKIKEETKFEQVSLGGCNLVAIDIEGNTWTFVDVYGEIMPKQMTNIEKCKVTFKNYDGTLLEEKEIKHGENATYTKETPVKEVIGYTSTFTGWDYSLENITEDTVFTAQFNDIANKHTLTLQPTGDTYEGDYGTTKTINAPQVTIQFNYNGNGQETTLINASFKRWTLTGKGSITSLTNSQIVYTYGDNDDILKANYNSVILPNTKRDGYVLEGWYTDPVEGEFVGKGGKTYATSENITLYAHWVEEELKFETDNKYINEEDKILYRINPNLTVEELKNQISTNGTIKIYNKDGEEIGNDELIGTGMVMKVETVTQSMELILSVKGDIDGNGETTATDLASINQQILKDISLEDVQFMAADINNDGIITATDLAAIVQVTLKELDLSTIE